MALKKTTKPPVQHQLRSDEASEQPLVNLRIERPEPQLAGAQLLLERAKNFAITDAETYTIAANTRQEIKAHYDAMEARRVKMKAPTLVAGREVDGFFNPALEALDEAVKVLTSNLKKYDDEQRAIAARKQREAEEEAQLARVEAERQVRETRKRAEAAMSRIQDIQGLTGLAYSGRPGGAKGNTIEAIHAALKEAEEWPITEESFGVYMEAAQKAKASTISQIKAMESQFITKQQQERIASEQAQARAAGDAERIRKAEEEAKVQRQAQLEARKAQLRAEEAQREAERQARLAAAASEAHAKALEQKAATTVAPTIEANLVQVNGLQRPKTWKWKLKDITKIKAEFLLVDEKSINRLVSTAKERAHAMVGEGAIEIYQDEGIRQ